MNEHALPLRFAVPGGKKRPRQVQNIRARAYLFMLSMSMGSAQALLREQSFTTNKECLRGTELLKLESEA
ncbi:hypothetical protein ACM41_00105 [Bradyrhizobium sp. CCBAU 21362]|nr:hypothetical protein [Bradyrhizobium sp. CCBAU 21362]